MEKQTGSGEERYELQVLQPQVENLLSQFDALLHGDSNSNRPLDDKERRDLDAIFKVLEDIMKKISKGDDDDKFFPRARSKREELGNLLPLIRAALDQRSKRPGGQQESSAGVAGDSEPASATTGCIPCTPRASKQQQSKKQQQEQEEKEGVSLTLLLRLAKNVLEPEQYYEWTTSYVDEERIYGWDEDAGKVIDALVAPDGSERMFRAAGIAGVHGSGKTALAQKVFVHDKAKDNFALRLWVCVGPPDSEDRFNLLYRMLDNLGLDTAKVEDIVDKSKVVTKAKEDEKKRILGERNATTGAGDDAAANTKAKEEEDRILEEKINSSRAVEKSKIGVLLYILNMTLSKTSYMIVFDDIRAYRRDGEDAQDCWYSNLTLLPPAEGEWGDRLGYGLPKGEHRGAVLVTCRKEDDAKIMARTGLVVRPPKLKVDDAWKLFRREYDQAKDEKREEEGGKVEEDLLIEQLEEMKEDIVNKCLGLPVAIIEAAKGFAVLDPARDLMPDDTSSTKEDAAAAAGGHTEESSKDMQQAEAADAAGKSEEDDDDDA